MFNEHLTFSIFDDPVVAQLSVKIPSLEIQFAQLELVPRRGWYQRNAPEECDTDGEHTRKVIWAARQLPAEKLGLNIDLMVELILFHDFPEKKGFDITIHDGYTREEKKALETAWCYELADDFGPNGYIAIDRWQTYDQKKIDEARWAGQLDKIDCLVHAMEKRKKGFNIDEFIETSQPHMADPFPQWLHFKLSSDNSGKEPYLLYKELLGSYEKFEATHDRYAESEIYHKAGFIEYLKVCEQNEMVSKLQILPRKVAQENSLGVATPV